MDDQRAPKTGVNSPAYRWYMAVQVVSVLGTMMGYTATAWLALHVRHGGPAALAGVSADGGTFLGVIMVVAVLARHTGQARPHVVPQARRFRWLLDLPPGARSAIVMALLVGGFGMQWQVTNALVARDVFGLGSVGFGLFGTCIAVGGIAGGYYSSRRKDPGRQEFIVWSLVFGAAACLAAIMPSAWAYDVTMVAVGLATQLFATSATVYVQQTTPPEQRGHVLSAYNAAFIGFVPAGAIVAAAIAVTTGVRWAIGGPALVIAATAGTLLAGGLAPRARQAARPG